MLILGLNTFHADAAAALVRDGHLVEAIAEERLNRVKHFAGFPEQAIRKVLARAGASIEDVDHIAIARDSKANLMSKLGFVFSNIGRIARIAKGRLENRAQIASVPTLIERAFGLSQGGLRATIHNVEHHVAHAASAFLVSPFREAAIMSVDGFGDFASTLFATGHENRIQTLDRILFPHSLGVLYTAVCQFIGYDQYGDEGKVMGLAPYGKADKRHLLDDMLVLKPRGRFELNLSYFIHHTEGVDYSFDEKGLPTVAPLYSPKLVEMFGPPRARKTEITQREMDLAGSVQELLETAYFHMLNHLHGEARTDSLCLAGGVALNSVANGKIFDKTPFKRVYIQPAAGDDGTSIGAAYHVWCSELERPRVYVQETALVGDEYTPEECRRALEKSGVPFTTMEPDMLCKTVAKEIADGKVVGWFQGRMEWGPRALGGRSIVAHPGHPRMKEILNARIKHREWFRPFAPSIMEERLGDVFEHDHPDPFMLMVYKIKPEWRERLCAVNHVDNTGRLQSVSKRVNPIYHKLISEFEALTGIPVVLNTSFNENEPIVHTPQDALDCFLRTNMDVLVLGPHYVNRQAYFLKAR